MKSLMIIDDDALLRRAIACVFDQDYHVTSCSSAEEAVPLLAAACPDIVLLDLALTGVDGLQFLSRLQEQYPDLPVVMISGVATSRTGAEALTAGAADFIRKPFDIGELRLRVERALDRQALRSQSVALQDHPSGTLDESIPLREAVEQFERARIERALSASGGVISQAAERMGTTRRILQYRIQKLGIRLLRAE